MSIKQKIKLRKTTPDDYKAYYEMHNDNEAKKNFHTYPKTLNEAKRELQENDKKDKSEGFCLIFNDEIAGFFWLKNIVKKHKAVVGFGLIKKFRGKGLGTEGLKKITKYAFKKYNLIRMETRTRAFNKPAQKIIEKAGYKLEGISKKCILQQNGRYSDEYFYGKIK